MEPRETTTTEIKYTSDITVRPVQSVGGDHMVVAAARVSTGGHEALKYADPARADENNGMIRYLMRHRHGTPFEHASLTFFVHAPAMVWWEWVRHRVGFSYNLESGRYKKLDPVFWVPRRDRKMVPAPNHRSARPKFLRANDYQYNMASIAARNAHEQAWASYEEMIGGGIANEVARSVLGFAIYYAGWVTCNPRSLMSFLSLRVYESTATFASYPQAEIEEAARAGESALASGWPLTHAAFNDHGRVAP